MINGLNLSTRQLRVKSKRSSALVITLIVLVMVTVLVVSLVGVIGFERVATHSSFENERAKQYANMALDEVVATLRDNIPTSTLWAAGPGHLQVYNTTSNSWTEINLHSGTNTASTSTGVVNINAPILGGSAATTYPIIPTNNIDYSAAKTMNVGWVDVLKDGSIIRNGSSTASVTSTNPIVGRYAYWVDTENAKLNLNVSGKGQTVYTFYQNNAQMAGSGINFSQNLTATPTRGDFSALDGGITPAQSIATYHYNNGSYYAGDFITNVGVANAVILNNAYGLSLPSTSNALTTGLQRFNSIYDWPQMTNDMYAPGTAVTPITSTQVELNKFYLTTKSRTPEVNPWGYNKWYVDAYLPELHSGTSVTTGLTPLGNVGNGKGYPAYPYNANSGAKYPPGNTYLSTNTYTVDSRFYVYPTVIPTKANPTNLYLDGSVQTMQTMAEYYGQTSYLITPVMQMLNRSDWPGMPSTSFVQKYGTNECIDLAYNLYWMLNQCVNQYSPDPNGFNGDNDQDYNEHYGKALQIYPTYNTSNTPPGGPAWQAQGSLPAGGNVPSRYMQPNGALEQPMINEIAVTFTPTTSGYEPTLTTDFHTVDPNAIKQIYNTAMVQDGGPMWSTQYGGYTKDGIRPGFAPPIGSGDPAAWTNAAVYTTGAESTATLAGNTGGGIRSGLWPSSSSTLTSKKSYLNIAITPAIQVWYPPYYQDGATNLLAGIWMLDILVTASGTYTPINPTNGTLSSSAITVVYGGANGTGTNNANGEPETYYWGFPDDHPLVFPNTSPTDTVLAATTGLQLTSNMTLDTTHPRFYGNQGAAVSTTNYWTMAYGTTSGSNTITTKPFYVGPFDAGSSATVTIQLRLVQSTMGRNTSNTAFLYTPMGSNYGTSASSSYPAGHYYGASNSNTTNTTPPYSSPREQQAFWNVVTNTAWSATLALGYTNMTVTAGNNYFTRYTVTDPRVSRYTSDWSLDTTAGGSVANLGIISGTGFNNFASSTTDSITGITGDYSKLAYPQVIAAWATEGNTTAGQLNNAVTADPRFAQFANNITSFPGIGWLSVLPLNLESSQGTTTSPPGASGTNPIWGFGSGTSSNAPIPWRTISLVPQPKNTNQLPDWLLLDIFSMAIDQSYLSQTDGKLNVNGGNVFPFNLVRTAPIKAMIHPTSTVIANYGYSANTNNPAYTPANLTTMATDMATNNLSSDANYATNVNFNLPTDMFVYTGQIAQLLSIDGASSTAPNQWMKEAAMRNLAGIVTTKCSDYLVHVYAQSIKQIFNSDGTTTLVVTGEQRMRALVSRETYTGQDNLPATSDDRDTGNTSIDPDWNTSWLAYRPTFKYVVSNVEYINN